MFGIVEKGLASLAMLVIFAGAPLVFKPAPFTPVVRPYILSAEEQKITDKVETVEKQLAELRAAYEEHSKVQNAHEEAVVERLTRNEERLNYLFTVNGIVVALIVTHFVGLFFKRDSKT